MAKLKEALLTVRCSPETRDQFTAAARMIGLTPASLAHHLIVKEIEEKRGIDPARFAEFFREAQEDADRRSKARKLSKKNVAGIAVAGVIHRGDDNAELKTKKGIR